MIVTQKPPAADPLVTTPTGDEQPLAEFDFNPVALRAMIRADGEEEKPTKTPAPKTDPVPAPDPTPQHVPGTEPFPEGEPIPGQCPIINP